MYKVEQREPRRFEFEYSGDILSVPAPSSLPADKTIELADAYETGHGAYTRWLLGYFLEQTGGAIADMPLEAFAELAAAWQASDPKADPGK